MKDAIRARLDAHNNNRVAVQKELKRVLTELENSIDKAEERVREELNKVFEDEDANLRLLVVDPEKRLGPNGLLASQRQSLPSELAGEFSCTGQSYNIVEHESEKKRFRDV